MKVSYNWLKQYVDLPQALSMDQLAYDLTMRTVEVEDVIDLKSKYKLIVAGLIESVNPHPNADALRLVMVDIGESEPVQIVCGGSNLEVGHYVAVTLPGAYALWHGEGEPVKIKKSSLRGESSYGMICGSNEIGLEGIFPAASDTAIIDLSAYPELKPEPGMPISELLGLDDFLIEIDNKSLTNRPDLWGHYGIAREISAIYGLPLKPLPELKIPELLPGYPIEIRDDALCHRFMAGHYTGLDSRRSPLWLQVALIKVDVRPINAIVDITNYVMLSTGQPTHAYDYDRVSGGFVIRRAEAGESLVLLDEKQIALTDRNLVIADEEKAIGLAGIMGGHEDSILASTRSILFEIGNFEAKNIRKTAQLYGLRTEASMRFEKGLDTQRADATFALAQQLIAEIFPQSRLCAYSDINNDPTGTSTIEVSLGWLSKRLGVSVDLERVRRLIAPLGFEVEAEGERLTVRVPSWRSTGDVSLMDDILEEVARMIGYESFELQPPSVKLDRAVNQREKQLDRRIREYLAFTCGFQEIFTYPWIRDEFIRASGIDASGMLELAQPPAPDQAKLRSSLVPGMLEAVVNNTRYFDEFSLFELTQVYEAGAMSPSTPEEVLPRQHRELAGAMVSNDVEKSFFGIKGILERLGDACQTESLSFDQIKRPSWADRNAWLNITLDGIAIGAMGLLSPMVKTKAGIKFAQVGMFALDVEALKAFDSRANTFEPLPLYPHVMQDLSIIVDESMSWADVRAAVQSKAHAVSFVDEYRGKQIPEGKKSMTFRVELASNEGTLTNEQIDKRMNSIQNKLLMLGASFREMQDHHGKETGSAE